MPDALKRIYGRIGFPDRVLFANFVSSVDGVVALGQVPSAGSVISGRDQHDRFLMGLLRACAQGVLLGAGTLRGTPGHRWTAGHIFPDMAASFAALRQTLGLEPEPRLLLVTASGSVDMAHPAITAGATFVTTAAQAPALKARLPAGCDLIEAGDRDSVDVRRAVEELRARGYERLLSEGGPHLIGDLVREGLLDEIFLTLSPVLAGRAREERLGMVQGVELLPDKGVWGTLLSARRNADYLYLRYGTAGS